MPDIPIVTAGGVVNTQKGEVILVMNQYASIRKGKTIHSSGQLESFGATVDDKSIKVGGYQRIITPDGYIIPLQVRNGLVYMDMLDTKICSKMLVRVTIGFRQKVWKLPIPS